MPAAKAISKVEPIDGGVRVTYQRGGGRSYEPEEKAVLVSQAKQQVALGRSYSEVASTMGLPATTLYGWLRKAGVDVGGGNRHRGRKVGASPVKRVPLVTDPKPGLVMVAVDLHQFVIDNRMRIIRELCLGKRDAIKTAVEEMTRPSVTEINLDAEGSL